MGEMLPILLESSSLLMSWVSFSSIFAKRAVRILGACISKIMKIITPAKKKQKNTGCESHFKCCQCVIIHTPNWNMCIFIARDKYLYLEAS